MIKLCTPSMLALLLAIFGVPVLALAGESTDQLKQTTDKILAIVQDPAMKGPDKDAERQKQMKKVVDERFDWTSMARSSIGKNWQALSEAQRTEFTGLFGELIEKTYMSKVESYSGEKIQYKGDKVDGIYGIVEVVIVTLRGTDIPVSYRVQKKGAEWLVYDVSIEGVSLVNNYRSQIGAILNSSNYDTLISRIKAKIEATPTEQGDKKAGITTQQKPGGRCAMKIAGIMGAVVAQTALAILILGCAGCRSMTPDQMRGAGARPVVAGQQGENADLPGIGEAPDVVPSAQLIVVSDPLEPVNRVFFHFNDKLYFWVLKPVSWGYSKVLPQPARRGVRNFLSNVTTPVRLVNCLLQAKFKGAWVETERFAINTTIGVAGFGDPARNWWNMEKGNEDLGQTLGRYGVGPWIYINWPIFGPSCPRDTIGLVGDLFLDPVNYLVPRLDYNAGIRAYDTVNDTSLRPGEYEDFKKAAIDPYVALRDAYYQYRRHIIENSDAKTAPPPAPALLPVK